MLQQCCYSCHLVHIPTLHVTRAPHTPRPATPQVIWGNVNPQWGETHNLYVQQRSKALLKLRVVDKNKLMSDVDLGVVMTGLDALLAKPGRCVELPLKGAGCCCCCCSCIQLGASCSDSRCLLDMIVLWGVADSAELEHNCTQLLGPTHVEPMAVNAMHVPAPAASSQAWPQCACCPRLLVYAHAGTNAQGKLVVSALFLPFSDDLIEAAVAEDTKKAPEMPAEVAQISTQLEVAMAVQDQLSSTVQQLATDLQQKVRQLWLG